MNRIKSKQTIPRGMFGVMKRVGMMRGKNLFEHGISSCEVSCDPKYFNRLLSVISAGNDEIWVFYKQWETEN